VINGCIEMGWLDHAHDIIEELELENFPVGIGTENFFCPHTRIKICLMNIVLS
jgi:pentatricopeptide repeat protein